LYSSAVPLSLSYTFNVHPSCTHGFNATHIIALCRRLIVQEAGDMIADEMPEKKKLLEMTAILSTINNKDLEPALR
jgi:hypothetical protein